MGSTPLAGEVVAGTILLEVVEVRATDGSLCSIVRATDLTSLGIGAYAVAKMLAEGPTTPEDVRDAARALMRAIYAGPEPELIVNRGAMPRG